MEEKSRYHRGISNDHAERNTQKHDVHDVFDFRKFKILFKKNIIWLFLFFSVAILAVFLYLRYTNVKFRSYSELKLNKRNEASAFGFNPLNSEESSNLNTLSGEVELIRSKLFLKRVVEKLPLDVTYKVLGRFKNDERYRFLPFTVDYSKACDFFNQRVYVKLYNDNEFQYALSEDSENWKKGYFGQAFSVKGCTFTLRKTQYFFIGQTLFFTLNSEESVLDYLENNLSVAPENLSANTIKITFEDYNPYKVQSIVEAISELYINFSKEQKNKANQLKIEFLNEQLKQTEQTLNAYEQYIENFTIENRTADPSDELSRQLDFLVQLDSTLYRFTYQINELKRNINAIKKDSLSIEGINADQLPPSSRSLMTELYEELTALRLAESRYKPSSQIIQQRKQRFTLLKQRVLENLSAQLNQLEILKENSLKRKRELERSFTSLPGKANELNQNLRFYKLYEQLYLSLMQKKSEFEVAQAGTLAEVVILTPANQPKSPIGPSTKLLYIGAFLIALIISVVFLLIKYLLYNEINSLNELERITNLSVIGSVSRLRSSVAKKKRVIVLERPRSQISEAFRTIRTNLSFVGLNKGHKILSVTSSTSGEGKTFISVNLAAILALSGKKTIILDLDMRKPRAQYAFNVNTNELGISAILSGSANWQECIHRSQNENLHFIPSGVIPPNPAELLESEYFKVLLNELKLYYDIVILDTPPIGLVSDGIIALKRADHNLFVVRSDYSKRYFIKDLHRNIELNDIKNISLVFNSEKKTNRNYGYYQDYYDDNSSVSTSTLKKLFNLS